MELHESTVCGRIQAPTDLHRVLKVLGLDEYEQERFLCFHLDTKHNLKGYTLVSIGLVDRTQVHAREVFRNAIISGASRVILAHNHPSGDPTPSAEDIRTTRQLVAAGKIIGIDVLDHVIIGDGSTGKGYVSFREENLLG
ncbi:MAG: JAB domain-containing protein [Lentisphaerae bacterium]|nr:JAB domain-containing protein [Lentisphaerota bacterium]